MKPATFPDRTGNVAGEIGILAYGSLINDPGPEIGSQIARRIPTQTPFPVEFGRFSRTRGGGPTLVPHNLGKRVNAEILVLQPGIAFSKATDLLWNRERKIYGSEHHYSVGNGPNSVLVKELVGFGGLPCVLYTDFPEEGKIPTPNARTLARAAVKSVKKADIGQDGISYLIGARESGVETVSSLQYQSEILALTKSKTLPQALATMQAIRLKADSEKRLCDRAGATATNKYFRRIEDCLVPGVCLSDFEKDLRAGAGCELDGKFLAVRSSSALAVNTFAPFRNRLADLKICGLSGFRDFSFEKQLPSGLSGTPPHLDVFLTGEHTVLAVESKFLEYLDRKKAVFAKSYSRTKLTQAEDCWWSVLEDFKKSGKRHLDVAQLVKHYLGLSRFMKEKNLPTATLLYIFWEPANAENLAVCCQHRAEIQELAERVSPSRVAFRWMSYPELWSHWKEVPALAEHAVNLEARYALTIGWKPPNR